MTEIVLQAELKRGDASLRSAEVLNSEGLCLDAMSRCYYAVLHYARAMLLTRDINPKSRVGWTKAVSFAHAGILKLEVHKVS